MRVLVACEFSGIVRDAFRARGHDAWSCDVLPSEGKLWHGAQFHYQCSIDQMWDGPVAHSFRLEGQLPEWDLMIAHPPCTYLAVSGARWMPMRTKEQRNAIDFVERLWARPVPRICIENPIGVLRKRSVLGKWAQIIQPHQFGHPEFKATCLWLKGLPPLKDTKVLTPPEKGSQKWKDWNRVHRCPPGPDRWKERSRTYQGIADAMAAQWG